MSEAAKPSARDARKSKRAKPPTSSSIDSLAAELNYAGDREAILRMNNHVRQILIANGIDPAVARSVDAERAAKKNYAQRLSEALAQKAADGLRPRFRGILPDEEGRGQESRARGASGLKRIDVNYMTPQAGLGLAVSIKTINFADKDTRRFTKNAKRVDGELRAEAEDVHTRQPYAVLVGLVFLPRAAVADGVVGHSSAHHILDIMRLRAGRKDEADLKSRFEAVFIGIYETAEDAFGSVRFYDAGRGETVTFDPGAGASFGDILFEIERIFERRNRR